MRYMRSGEACAHPPTHPMDMSGQRALLGCWLPTDLFKIVCKPVAVTYITCLMPQQVCYGMAPQGFFLSGLRGDSGAVLPNRRGVGKASGPPRCDR